MMGKSIQNKLKLKRNYDPDTPRCVNCVNFRKSVVVLTRDSNTCLTRKLCTLGGISVAESGLCDLWEDKVTNVKLTIEELKL